METQTISETTSSSSANLIPLENPASCFPVKLIQSVFGFEILEVNILFISAAIIKDRAGELQFIDSIKFILGYRCLQAI